MGWTPDGCVFVYVFVYGFLTLRSEHLFSTECISGYACEYQGRSRRVSSELFILGVFVSLVGVFFSQPFLIIHECMCGGVWECMCECSCMHTCIHMAGLAFETRTINLELFA